MFRSQCTMGPNKVIQQFRLFYQYIIALIMKKTRTAIYFQKRYCLLVHSLSLNQRMSITAFSANSSDKQTIDRACTYPINQIVYINCIDVIRDGVTTNDTEAVLHFNSLGEKMIKKIDVAVVRFDMNQEKIVKPQSSVLFTKELVEGKGSLQYKFINLKTRTLTLQQFSLSKQRRDELQVQTSHDEHSFKIQELTKLITQKDDLIQMLQKKIENLIVENRKIKDKSLDHRQFSKEKAMNINVKVNPVIDSMRKANEQLMEKLTEMQQRNKQLEGQIIRIEEKRQILEQQLAVANKKIFEKNQRMKVQIHNQNQSRARRQTSFIGNPSFMKNSNADHYAMNQSNADWSQQQQPTTKITVNQAQKNASVIRNDSQAGFRQNQSQIPQTSKNKMSQSKAQMFASSYLGSQAASQTPQKSQVADPVTQRINPDLDPNDESALRKRISMQQEQYKWSSLVYERTQEIEILKRKLESRGNEVKNLEKELEKAKVQLKKKEVEIKQLRKQSKKSLYFGQGSSRELTKNRTQLEAQFQRMQADHDNQKMRLQQEIQRIESQRQQLDKQNKKIKAIMLEKQERQKTIQAKYTELKKFANRRQEQFIQYKEKSMQYDTLSSRSKEIEGALKILDQKSKSFQRDNKKLSDLNNNLTGRFKELQVQWQRLKKIQKEHQILKNNYYNVNKLNTNFQMRLQDLKKYCSKVEAAYTKLLNSKKKNSSEAASMAESIKEDKELQQRFQQLHRRMEDAEISFYKQQLQDITEEKSFLNIYFEKKMKQERDYIYQAKEFNEEQKRSIIMEKQKQNEKAMQEKLEQIKAKEKLIERTLEEVLNRINQSKQSGINKSIPQQLRIMEKKLSTFLEKQQQRMNQRKNLKETIGQLSEQLKRASSSAHLNPQTLNKNLSTSAVKNQLLLSMVQQSKQQSLKRATILDQVRMRSEAAQQKSMQQNRKITQLVKENGDLKMKNQKLTLDMEKIERKTQQRQKQLEKTFRTTESQFKLKNENLTEKLEKKNAEIENLKDVIADKKDGIEKLSLQIANLSIQYEQLEKQNQKLLEQISEYQKAIQNYQKAERIMLDEISQIKKDAEHNQNELFALVETRSDNFAKIEKIKEIEVEKLKGIISQLEMKLQAQMFENIQSKQRIEELRANNEKLQKETEEMVLKEKINLQNREAEYDQLYQKEFRTSKENELLQENLMEISTQIQNKQVQIAQMVIELTRKNKQIQLYKQQAEKYEHMESKYKDNIKELQYMLDDKIQQIRGFQDKYKQFQMEIEYTSKDIQRLTMSSIKFESEAKQFQQKYLSKQEEIIKVKQQYSFLELQVHKIQTHCSNLQKENQQLRHNIEDYQRQIQRLNEINSSAALRTSRKISGDADKLDTSSPGRSKKIIPKTGALQIPEMSMIGAGGITPILSKSYNPLARKISQNPFEPREEIRKSKKLLRGTSIDKSQAYEPNEHEEEDIAVNVQPPHELKLQNKSSSNVEIQYEDMQESLRLTSPPIPKQSKKPETAVQIREQTEQNQQQSAAFARNFDFGDSKQDLVDDHEEYLKQIEDLNIQLNLSNKQNIQLQKENAELMKKIDELTSQIQQSQSRSASLGVSRRRSTLQPPTVGPKENTQRQSSQGRIEKNPAPSQSALPENPLRRTNSGIQLQTSHEGARNMNNAGKVENVQEKYVEAEMYIQQLTAQIHNLRTELEEMTKNNELLIGEAELCRGTIDELNERLEEAHFQIQQIKNFIQFQQLYNQQKAASNNLRVKIQELNGQIFAKEQQIYTLINENSQAMQQINQAKNEQFSTLDSKEKVEQKVRELTNTINKLKVQYRKYEQSSELQIVKLNETIDDLVSKLKQKDQQIQVLGEEFLALQEQKENLDNIIQQSGRKTKKKDYEQSQLQQRCNQLQEEIDKTEQNKKNLYRTIKQLQIQLAERDEKTKNVSNEVSLVVKKYQIKLQSNQQQVQMIQSKLAQKEKIITSLKNEIGLYNEECIQLKSLNDQLTYQSTKVEKQLKDIMKTYTSEIQSYKELITFKDKEAEKLSSALAEKQNEYHSVLKNMRMVEKQKDNIHCEYVDLKNNFEKFKNTKNKELNDMNVQTQYKNSQCQKLKGLIEKYQTEMQSKQEYIREETQKYDNRLKAYKEKLQRYEKLTQQFEIQLKKVQQRPTFEAHQQVLFENQILKNRVEELQEQLKSNNKNGVREKQQMIYMEYRKYKANKERQIQDLNSEMEKYGYKINQLEQSMFELKRQNDALRRQNHKYSEETQDLRIQCEDLKDSLQQVEKELQFYKKRKLLDMQKLLNETQ